jgi:superfamily I DNA and/or RNA helicase
VGDPLQLQPVVTLPWAGQRALFEQFGVSSEWAPSRTSVQQIADQHARHGTWLPTSASDDRIWVGTPLRVHRRCDRPMFDISNTIAYHGLMVYGTDERAPFHDDDGWIDIRSSAAEGHWIPAEGEALRAVLTDLHVAGVCADEIRVLAPFRVVAENASKIHGEVFPEVPAKKRDDWVGTVHTMQGKEADVVVLVLGGDPRKPGAREFATGSPNLLNVAVTRAKRRLYVIGNRATWGREGHFTVLAERLPVAQPPGSAKNANPVEAVWVTRSRRRYHIKPSCEALQEGLLKAERMGRRVSQPQQVPLQTALADGITGCQKCYPDQTFR